MDGAAIFNMGIRVADRSVVLNCILIREQSLHEGIGKAIYKGQTKVDTFITSY